MNYRVALPLVMLAVWGLLTAKGAESEAVLVRRSVVQITATTLNPDYAEPWKPGNEAGGVGSGFVVEGGLIMTNAHVVSNATLLEVQKEGHPKRHIAQVKFIAHDCDLALIDVADRSFYDDTAPLHFGGIPELESAVAVYGYPIGGERLSVTRGIVSRIEFRTYAHSALDAHLTVQVDAAINPGNSGGPCLQNGKVVGVAFQAYSGAVAQNTGYIIPTPVIERFFEDLKDGRYDGYVELAVQYLPLMNDSYRRFLGLPPDYQGVIVTDVPSAGSAAGMVQRGDVLLRIDGHPIYSNGHIKFDGTDLQMEEIVERKFHGDQVAFDLLRAGQPQRVAVTLKGAWPYGIYTNEYDCRPRYVVFAGLVFQPLSSNFLAARKLQQLDVLWHYDNFITNELYLERPELIILSTVIEDEVNRDYDGLVERLVDQVNGTPVKTLEQLHQLLTQQADRYVIEFLNENRPIVLSAAEAAAARARIRERYQVTREFQLEKKKGK